MRSGHNKPVFCTLLVQCTRQRPRMVLHQQAAGCYDGKKLLTADTMYSILPWILNGSLIALAVFIHYETLYSLASHLPRLTRVSPRYRVLLGVFAILLAHAGEIWVFALGYFAMINLGMGSLFGMTTPDLLSDCVYLSWIAFTTVGFGDIAATGALRFLPGLEALTGLVLITWSASFLFIEMQKFWPMARQVEHKPDSRDH